MVEVVELGEDAELGKFGHSRDEHETDVCSLVFQHLVELAWHRAHGFELFLLVHEAHDGSVVFVDDNHNTVACLLAGTVNLSQEW